MNPTVGFVLVFLLVAALAAILFIRNRSRALLKRTSDEYEQKITTLEKIRDEYRLKYERLQRYEAIVDAEATASELLAKANTEAETLTTAAQLKLDQAQQASKEVQTKARADAKALREKADELLRNATTEAGRIVDAAREKAVEIAGDAYEAMKNAENYEKTAKAMKNIIEGYGIEYIVPSYTLIDDLADEFGYMEAGEELKKARARTRLMVQNSTAAKCDYVEQNRKETAIRFVLDAFNGKVDSILAEAKKENHGKLEQMVKDAFQTVNFNGTAFRNAAITEEYLSARLEELRYLAMIQELKAKEREEQRRIKEEMREEEKARREFERAKKEAEKEAELVRKAMEKVSGQLAVATEQQRAKYEAQLAELTAKLVEAEEKNQRALSMAQQTKTGHIYIISNIGSFGEDVYKIGMTRRLEPLDRIRELGDASVPFEFDVHALVLSDDAPALEKQLHRNFMAMQMNKVNPRKEFFRVGIKDIKDEIDKLGLDVKWTMTAEARQYRESLAIEERMKNDAAARTEWERMQLAFEPANEADDADADS